MCGILGILSSNPQHFTYANEQLKCIIHRGPDEQGVWSSTPVLLGNCRLSIIDLAGGSQPMFNEDKSCCIVYNGEVYNFQDLRSQLQSKGHTFRTESDTEVVLHAYEEWGTECLKRFNGMFAFGIWDGRKGELFVARDRIGEKPLYYYWDGNRLIFASEIKAIVADPSVPRTINPRGLVNFLKYGHAVAPDTMYRNIHKLLPGNYLLAKGAKIRTEEYWDVGDEPQVADDVTLTESEYSSRICSLLEDSVRRRMVADVPVGAFLSGGIDSSAIVALMKRHATGRVKTFSLGFGIGGPYNELSDARAVATYLDTEHYELQADHLDMVSLLQKLVYQYDEPFGDAANFPVYLLSEFARKEVKVVLAGEGGDELFGGYRRYVADQVAQRYQALPRFFIEGVLPRAAGMLPRFRRLKRISTTLPIHDPALRYSAWLEVFTREMQGMLLSQTWSKEIADYDSSWQYSHYYHKKMNRGSDLDHLNRLMYVDLKTWLPDTFMEKVDKATMAFGLEGRLPFLDHRLVELAFQIPSKLKIRGRTTKRILKQAVGHLLPMQVLTKPKHGFAVPTDPWFRGELKEFVFETLLDERSKRRGYFNHAYIEKLYNLHRSGKEVYDNALWLLLNFELWHRTFIDGHTQTD